MIVIKGIVFFIGGLWMMGCFPGRVFCLEALTSHQLKQTIAQAGIDIAMEDVVIEIQSDGLTLSNPDDNSQYLTFGDVHYLSSLDTGMSDVNLDGDINHLSMDVVNVSGQVMLFAESPDMALATDMVVASIDFSGTVIGSLNVENMVVSAFHAYLGPHAGKNGVDMELGCRLDVAAWSFGYNTTDALALTGIHAAESFSGTLEDPATWAAAGEFQVGDLAGNNPATMDITADTVAGWTMTDGAGTTYSVSNPRYNSGYVVLNVPMKGSLRVENMDFGEKDLGLLAIDGMDVQKLVIEIPGRGLGKR